MSKVTDTDAVVVDYEQGREYANQISSEIKDIKEQILFVEYVPVSVNRIAPGTTPFVTDLNNCVEDLREVLQYLYANESEKESLMKQIIDTIQIIYNCKKDVYKFPQTDLESIDTL